MTSVGDSELVRRVYARSWPTTCRDDYTPDQIIARLGDRDQLWWNQKIQASPVRFVVGSRSGGQGFVLAGNNGEMWEISHLFCEPGAFGSGMAVALHDAAVAELSVVANHVCAFVLPGNERSQRFFARQGWSCVGMQRPPWPTSLELLRFERALGSPD
jgi:hypothetical protein